MNSTNDANNPPKTAARSKPSPLIRQEVSAKQRASGQYCPPLTRTRSVIGEIACACLAAGHGVSEQLERLTLERGLTVRVLGDQARLVRAMRSNE